MKKIYKELHRNAVTLLVITILLAASCNSSHFTAASATSTDMINLADTTRWTFTAIQVMPQYGRTSHVTSSYTVTHSNNKLVVYLPYFGKAYAGAGYNTEGNPLDFTSSDFTENKQQKKPGRWTINIQPKDNREVQAMNFTFFSNGNATLTITMVSRSGISFSGTVEGIK